MSVLTCADVRDLAPELALGILGGAERAEVVLHVNRCARCQASVAELAEAADAIPQLVPDAEPPPGFEARVLHRLGADRRRTRRRWVASAAAVAAAATIVSITAVRVIESGGSTSTTVAAPATAGTAPVAVALQDTASDLPAGWAYVSGARGLAVTVSYGVAAGGYAVQVKSPDGVAETLGTMTIAHTHGSWTGQTTRPIRGGSTIALVDGAGAAVCHGVVPATQ